MRCFFLLIGSLAVATVGLARAESDPRNSSPAQGAACFDAATLSNRIVGSGSALVVSAGPTSEFEVELSGPNCTAEFWQANWTSAAHAQDQVCVSDPPGRILVSQFGGPAEPPAQCTVARVRRVVRLPR